MHCWKSYNVDKKYHFNRHFFISTLIALLFFITIYVPVQIIANAPLQDQNFLVFLTAFILIYPIHKLLHFLAIANYYKHLRLEMCIYFRFLPIVDIKVTNPIPTIRFAFALICPFFIINLILSACMYIFPEYVHYLTILLAYHMGICAVDLHYLKSLYSSPKDSLLEETERGYEILVKE